MARDAFLSRGDGETGDSINMGTGTPYRIVPGTLELSVPGTIRFTLRVMPDDGAEATRVELIRAVAEKLSQAETFANGGPGNGVTFGLRRRTNQMAYFDLTGGDLSHVAFAPGGDFEDVAVVMSCWPYPRSDAWDLGEFEVTNGAAVIPLEGVPGMVPALVRAEITDTSASGAINRVHWNTIPAQGLDLDDAFNPWIDLEADGGTETADATALGGTVIERTTTSLLPVGLATATLPDDELYKGVFDLYVRYRASGAALSAPANPETTVDEAVVIGEAIVRQQATSTPEAHFAGATNFTFDEADDGDTHSFPFNSSAYEYILLFVRQSSYGTPSGGTATPSIDESGVGSPATLVPQGTLGDEVEGFPGSGTRVYLAKKPAGSITMQGVDFDLQYFIAGGDPGPYPDQTVQALAIGLTGLANYPLDQLIDHLTGTSDLRGHHYEGAATTTPRQLAVLVVPGGNPADSLLDWATVAYTTDQYDWLYGGISGGATASAQSNDYAGGVNGFWFAATRTYEPEGSTPRVRVIFDKAETEAGGLLIFRPTVTTTTIPSAEYQEPTPGELVAGTYEGRVRALDAANGVSNAVDLPDAIVSIDRSAITYAWDAVTDATMYEIVLFDGERYYAFLTSGTTLTITSLADGAQVDGFPSLTGATSAAPRLEAIVGTAGDLSFKPCPEVVLIADDTWRITRLVSGRDLPPTAAAINGERLRGAVALRLRSGNGASATVEVDALWAASHAGARATFEVPALDSDSPHRWMLETHRSGRGANGWLENLDTGGEAGVLRTRGAPLVPPGDSIATLLFEGEDGEVAAIDDHTATVTLTAYPRWLWEASVPS